MTTTTDTPYQKFHGNMEPQKDSNGFELQNTVAASTGKDERRQSIPTETPRVPQNNSSKGPPKPSKSSSLPKTPKTTATVENGNGVKSKAAEAEEGGFLAINCGYFKSWQFVLKVVKMLCFIAMIVSLSYPISGISGLPKISRFDSLFKRLGTLHFGLAVAVIGFIIDAVLLVIYLLGFNSFISKLFSPLPWVVTGCHIVMWVLIFAAPIAINVDVWTGAAITSFVTFDMLALVGYTLELYFNMVWLKGGPELACLPFF